ncbi:MAG: hypothetical protein GXO79_05500 [Chlorobi bacterium]|nr:hypothetical protein [Chlorobiota bacterium]
MIENRISELYEAFNNFPSHNSIVRNGIRNDAFTIVAFEILFNPYHKINKFRYDEENHRELIKKAIVPPPDDHIDVFYEEEDLDDRHYHVVQVKNKQLQPSEIEVCFKMMESSISLFLKKNKEVNKNLRKIISETDFCDAFKRNVSYYVVHIGETNYVRNQKNNQYVITQKELLLLSNGVKKESVPNEFFTIDTVNNFIVNNYMDKPNITATNNHIPKSILCNFNGYDLARLNNRYSNTVLGRNILYGQNLRESLSKKSKTYDRMFDTVDKEPELFLYYNNGITILSKDFDAKTINEKEQIELIDFSIINGAQTTSTLGAYLKEAEILGDNEKIENLKKVYVLTKIYEINSKLPNHEKISENIKINTNTQTPLSSRDMVSIRKEQIKMQRRFIEDFQYPNIFIYIKKGEKIIDFPKFLPHQQITNEKLAQLTLCGYFKEPFSAKDKKSKIFDYEPQNNFTLNKYYHRIFDENDGILFKKSNIELDELLFISRLHDDSKKFHKESLKKQLNKLNQEPARDERDKNTRSNRIDRIKRSFEITNVCLFYNVSAYYILKQHYDCDISDREKRIFDTKRYYANKDYKSTLIKDFLDLIYITSIKIIRENSGIENVNNWLRDKKSERIFIDNLEDILTNKEYIYSEKYNDFIEKHTIISS